MTERIVVQPKYPARIDTSDPMGALARFAVIGNFTVPIELLGGIQPGGTPGAIAATPFGTGYVLPSSAATTWQKDAAGLDPYIGDSITVCWYGLLRDDTIQQLLTFGSGYGWRLKTSNWGAGQLRIGIEQFWGGGYTGGIFPIVDNTLHTIVLRYDGAALALDVFIDGVLAGSYGSIKDGGAILASPVFSMLAEPTGTKPHVMATAQAFAGWFTDDQVRIWSGNPWHIFEPEEEFGFVPASTGGGTVTLAGAASSQANGSSAAGITQTHALAGALSAQANPGATGAISQIHAIAAANAAQQNAGSAAGIVISGELAAAPSAQANQSSAGAITQAHQLAAAPSAQANPSATGAISQAHQLAASPSAQGNSALAAGVSQAHQLAGAGAGQANPASAAAIAQAHILIHAPSIQDNIAAASAVVQQHILAAAASQQANQAPGAAIQTPINGQPSTQSNASSAGSISVNRVLTAAGAQQNNISGTGATSNGVVADEWLTNLKTTSYGIKKAGIPNDAPAWLKTDMEIVLGRRNNRVPVPVKRTLTFSATPTKDECEALYAYVNDMQDSLNRLITRFDS